MPPLRQALVVQAAGVAGRWVGPHAGLLVYLLARRRGASGFAWAERDTPLEAGDELVIYRLRRGVRADLERANSLFSGRFYGQGASAAPRDPWPDEQEIIERWTPDSGARVLEICSGTGRLLSALQRDGNRVVGADISAACVAAARSAAPGAFHCTADARSLPFPAASFAVAVCLDNSLGVFFDRPERVLAELARVCEPGGHVILGLRAVLGAAERLQAHASADGYLELAFSFPVDLTRRFAERLRSAGPLLPVRQLPPMGSRPWGGHVHYLVLERRPR